MRWLIAILAVCAVTKRLQGEEAIAHERQVSPINAVKHDYDSIKASRLPSEQSKLELPAAITPELRIGSGQAHILQPSSETKTNEQSKHGANAQPKSANWLVDAMKGKTDPLKLDSGGDENTPADERGSLESSHTPRNRTESLARHETKSTSHPDKTEQAANPLNNFMAAWMTHGDYELLKPTLETPSRADAWGTAARSTDQLILPAVAPNSLTANAPGLGFRGSEGIFPSISHGNPYLVETTIPVADPIRPVIGAQNVPNMGSMAPTAATSEISTPADQSSKPATASELLKSRDDSKYFPQLKRF